MITTTTCVPPGGGRLRQIVTKTDKQNEKSELTRGAGAAMQGGMSEEQTDNRTAAQLLRQHEKLNKVRAQLIRMGLINGDAKAEDVIGCLRSQIPADMFGDA